MVFYIVSESNAAFFVTVLQLHKVKKKKKIM